MQGENPPEEKDSGDPIERAVEHIHSAEHEIDEGQRLERRGEEDLRRATEELERAEHPRETEIIVNARPRKVPGNEVTFGEIVKLAFPAPDPNPNVIYSMTYRHAASQPPAGELAAGGKVRVKHGTIFNVTKTTKS
jgi:hypothetical protein